MTSLLLTANAEAEDRLWEEYQDEWTSKQLGNNIAQFLIFKNFIMSKQPHSAYCNGKKHPDTCMYHQCLRCMRELDYDRVTGNCPVAEKVGYKVTLDVLQSMDILRLIASKATKKCKWLKCNWWDQTHLIHELSSTHIRELIQLGYMRLDGWLEEATEREKLMDVYLFLIDANNPLLQVGAFEDIFQYVNGSTIIDGDISRVQ
jgi:hypothetical protein